MYVIDCWKMRNMVKLRMELQTFDPGIFMVTTLAFYPDVLPGLGRLVPGMGQDASLAIVSEITTHKRMKKKIKN